MNISIRRANTEDWPAIWDFIKLQYGFAADYKNRDRWNWQFSSNPMNDPDDRRPTFWIAEDIAKGIIVGQMAAQCTFLQLHSTRYPAAWIVDLIVDNNYRGKGIAHRLHSAIANDIPTLMAITMAPATRKISEKHGCTTISSTYEFARLVHAEPCDYEKYIINKTRRLCRTQAMIRQIFNRTKAHHPLATIGNATSNLFNPLAFDDKSIREEIEAVDTYTCEDDIFFYETAKRRHATTGRSSISWNWRFRDAPMLQYKKYRIRYQGSIAGHIVIRDSLNVEFPSTTIVELLTRPHDYRSMSALLRHAHRLTSPQSKTITAGASSLDIILCYLHHGYLPVRRLRPTLVSNNNDILDYVKNLRHRWHFSKADHDWDQIHPANQ